MENSQNSSQKTSQSLSEKIETLQKFINESSQIVFFGGAGVSTESGIPDFRSTDGLYNQKWKFPPETILSKSFFYSNPQEFFRFYREKILIQGIKPNAAHFKLAELEEKGKLSAVITQNIDGLHQAAGSKNVLELHGTTLKNYCIKCGTFYDINYIIQNQDSQGIPRCSKKDCNGIIKPDVVLYEENLNEQTLDSAMKAISSSDMLIIGGTSLSVYPAAGLIRYFSGKHLVLINRDPIPSDSYSDLVIHESIGKVLSQIKC